MANVIFADIGPVANPSGDLIKIALSMKAGNNEEAETGTLVLTQWAAMLLAASLYEALKSANKQREAKVIDMKKAKRKLDAEPGLRGA